MAGKNVKAPEIQAVGQESMEDKIRSLRQAEAHQRMEKELYGEGPESPGAKRTRKEAALKDKTMLGLYAEEKNLPRKLKNALTGEDDYGTSLSKGAMQAADKAAKEHAETGTWKDGSSSKTRGQISAESMVEARKAAREAASEERREARGMKKGGSVSSASSRADGCAIRGKTKGRII